MSRIPDYTHNMSLRMSQVMDEIGVNEQIVMKRRKTFLLRESITTLTLQLTDNDMKTCMYHFGSQIEGTTILGLNSDIDCLFADNRFNVIQDWSEWEHGKHNLLMIQDETVPSGYCMLQELRDDAPLPAMVEINEHSFRDERGRILRQNTIYNDIGGDLYVRHGPAQSGEGGPGFYDNDFVPAYTCQSYPAQARQWLDQQRVGHWPSNDMIQYCVNTGCFVVPVGNKGSEKEILEWRISTSLAERCLMFNLNITQIRCYVLMKMIMKTFINPQYPESISSFMCKTVLIHCISNTRADEWKESTLLTCLSFCLSTLYKCVLNEYCPHFLIPENNLLMRRFSREYKPFILEVLHFVIVSNGRALLDIHCDRFGLLLQRSLNGVRNEQSVSAGIAGQLLLQTALHINCTCSRLLCDIKRLSSRNAIRKISYIMSKIIHSQDKYFDCKCLIAKTLCHTMGTILASSSIDRGDNLSNNASSLMTVGLNSDVASCKLKLSSVFYCIGDIERTELILNNIEECYDLSKVEPICNCYDFKHASRRERFNILCYESIEQHTMLKHITASCVRFVRCEVNCCPHELRHEMFRSTQEDIASRAEKVDRWMDMAVVDSLPYLYFLQYKAYTSLGKENEKRKALSNLVRTIEEEPNLGHRETALNLLGQCMESENRKDNALKCYMLSLKVRDRNNAAKFLICKLLSTVINGRAVNVH